MFSAERAFRTAYRRVLPGSGAGNRASRPGYSRASQCQRARQKLFDFGRFRILCFPPAQRGEVEASPRDYAASVAQNVETTPQQLVIANAGMRGVNNFSPVDSSAIVDTNHAPTPETFLAKTQIALTHYSNGYYNALAQFAYQCLCRPPSASDSRHYRFPIRADDDGRIEAEDAAAASCTGGTAAAVARGDRGDEFRHGHHQHQALREAGPERAAHSAGPGAVESAAAAGADPRVLRRLRGPLGLPRRLPVRQDHLHGPQARQVPGAALLRRGGPGQRRRRPLPRRVLQDGGGRVARQGPVPIQRPHSRGRALGLRVARPHACAPPAAEAHPAGGVLSAAGRPQHLHESLGREPFG
ncbi:hypothetical protein ON010_g3201 [Phytophthora cinnamomi]|nr:hypothetical protein ON010_g3201 [Phytophthora cinnamomi]